MELLGVNSYLERGFTKYGVDFFDINGQPRGISIAAPDWNRSGIVNSLIRSVYSQDRVEAIINNHFLAIGEWLEKKLAGSSEPFVDPDYDELQLWRETCKQWADEALAQYPPVQ